MSGAPGLPFTGLRLLSIYFFPSEIDSLINLDIYFWSFPNCYIEYTLENVPDLEATEEWLAEYLNDTEMQFSPDDLYASLHRWIFSLWFIYTIIWHFCYLNQEFFRSRWCAYWCCRYMTLFSTNFSTNIAILDCFLCGLNFIQKSFFLLQSYATSHHRINKTWFRSLLLEPLKILSSKVCHCL